MRLWYLPTTLANTSSNDRRTRPDTELARCATVRGSPPHDPIGRITPFVVPRTPQPADGIRAIAHWALRARPREDRAAPCPLHTAQQGSCFPPWAYLDLALFSTVPQELFIGYLHVGMAHYLKEPQKTVDILLRLLYAARARETGHTTKAKTRQGIHGLFPAGGSSGPVLPGSSGVFSLGLGGIVRSSPDSCFSVLFL